MLRTAWMMLATATVSAAQAPYLTDLVNIFKIEIVMPQALGNELPQDQIKKDIELILRRNGVPIGEESQVPQYIQLTFRAVRSEDRNSYAINLRLDLLIPGYTLGRAITCSGKPSTDSCWTNSGRLIGYWSDERLLLVGASWVPEVRQTVKDLTESFALYYLRITQKTK